MELTKVTDKKANEMYRNEVIESIYQMLQTNGEDVMQVKTNKIAFPFVNSNGSDEFIEITVSVPLGSRDKEPYDAYALAEEFETKRKKDLERAKKKEEEKQKKIAKDNKKREIAKQRQSEQ